jgi:hypothetical protein
LYLTTSPIDGGQPNTPLFDRPVASRVVARKHDTGADSGVVIERYRF